jgi:hypothetical protein
MADNQKKMRRPRQALSRYRLLIRFMGFAEVWRRRHCLFRDLKPRLYLSHQLLFPGFHPLEKWVRRIDARIVF